MLRGAAFITGAASGIGQFTSYTLAKHGIKCLAISDRNASALRNTASELKARFPPLEVASLHVDVTDEKSVEDGIAETVRNFGRLDLAVNNAGIVGSGTMTDKTSAEEWDSILIVNLSGVWRCQKAQLSRMLKQDSLGPREGRGTIVNVASVLGVIGTPAYMPTASYIASEHGVLGLTKADAIDYAQHGIRINAICPGYVETPLLLGNPFVFNLFEEKKKIHMGRLCSMEEIADCIVFLASPMSSYMCGTGMIADGGYSIA